MIKYPIIVVDDFFEDPDAIHDLGMSVDYPIDLPSWPGKRSESLEVIDRRLSDYFISKVFSAFGLRPNSCYLTAGFQKILPYSPNKWNPRNRGWIHRDAGNVIFGGIVYLTKNADKDTGTSIYKPKKGYAITLDEDNSMKESLYKEEDIDDEQYNKAYNEHTDQFEETIKVDNIYNRFFSFPNTTWHGVRTCGTEERLTIPFFCHKVD